MTKGILLINLGTPDAPTIECVRRYLAEFLWDEKVIPMWRPLWWFLLHGLILRVRPAISAKKYQQIWTAQGSPMWVNSKNLAAELQKYLGESHKVALAMRYGLPSIKETLDHLKAAQIDELVILPLFPQYAEVTTGSIFEAVMNELRGWSCLPKLHFINQFADHPDYIQCLTESIHTAIQVHGKPQKILFSFHGLPEKSLAPDDPYPLSCHLTSRLVAQELKLASHEWQVVFQSEFGLKRWLKPSCVETLQVLARTGYRHVMVLCPGFPADCLETLEEIAIINRQKFLKAGGKLYHYIPALNANPNFVKCLAGIVRF